MKEQADEAKAASGETKKRGRPRRS